MKAIVFSLIILIFCTVVNGIDIVTPSQFLGFPVGADRKLANWVQISEYFQLLDSKSNRVLVQEIGKTTENNPFLLVTISSKENLNNLKHYLEIQNQLADPRKVKDSPAQLISEGKTIILVTCGIHATEVSSPQMSMEFAWEIATQNDKDTSEILENVIFLLVPSLNPDGVNIVVNWYRKTLNTPAEGLPPPWLYHKYTGHDNNRDWYMFTQRETRIAIKEIQNKWHPHIVFDMHQMSPTSARIFVPPYIDPIDSNVDPLIQAQIIDLGGFLFSALASSGRKGIVTNAIYDAFTPARAYQHYHGGVRLLSESASARLATPVFINSRELDKGRNYHGLKPSWNFPEPWEGGRWSLRDIVDDQKVALKACLIHGAKNRRRWLQNFLKIGRNSIKRLSPFAFIIPTKQNDSKAVQDLLEILEFGMVELHRAAEDLPGKELVCSSPPFCDDNAKGIVEGDIVVLLQQPYSSFAKTMLEIQNYPDLRDYPGGPIKEPYDVTAHTLGSQLGVFVYRIDSPLDLRLTSIDSIKAPSPVTSGKGDYWLFSHANSSFAKLSNRLLRYGHRVEWATYGFRLNKHPYGVGTLMARINRGKRDTSDEILKGINIEVQKVEKRPQIAWERIHQPIIGLYQGYDVSTDEGWTRWILEQNEFNYKTLKDRDIRIGSLKEFDVIVFADQNPRGIINGLDYPYPKEYRGGIGEEGLARLRQFAARGGTLILLGESGKLLIDRWDLEISEFTGSLSKRDFFIPGSLVRIRVNTKHPIGYGMMERSAAMFIRSPVLESKRFVSIASYQGENLLLSGWSNGEGYLKGRQAVFEVPIEKGRSIFIGFRCQFRAQTRVTYKLLFNSLFYSTTH